jgi:O-antigen ligase
MDSLLAATLVLAAVITVLALGASQWNSKSVSLEFIIDVLPRIADRLAAVDAKGGFNANEMAGALAFVCPLLGGLVAYHWGRYNRPLRIITIILFGLLFLALFLGQSRFALAGTLIALMALAGLLIPNRKWRWLAWAGLVAIAVLEIMIMRDVFSPPEQQALALRDEDSINTRFDIWQSALDIIRDYPLTGVGLNMFRDGRVRAKYPVPSFTSPVLPHTHQEWLQIGTDMGLPGLIVWLGLQITVMYQLFKGCQQGDAAAKAVTASVGAGLFAHGFFGLGDAITLWDRFAFLLWWLLALAGAQTFLLREKSQL